MAYREDLTLTDLALCGRLFRAVRSNATWSQLVPRKTFEIAHACTGLLDDLHQEFIDAHPRLEIAPYRNSQTHYGKWIEPSDKSESHSLRWTISKGNWKKWHFAYSIYWSEKPQDGGRIFVMLQGSNVTPRYATVALKRFLTKGVLDRDKLFGHLQSCARDWGVTKTDSRSG